MNSGDLGTYAAYAFIGAGLGIVASVAAGDAPSRSYWVILGAVLSVPFGFFHLNKPLLLRKGKTEQEYSAHPSQR